MLKIENVHAERDKKEILRGVTVTVKKGEIHALMGPNGSGKSTLASALMGHPDISVTAGSVTIDETPLFTLEVHERAIAGLFLAFQYPLEISGVPYLEFLRLAYNSVQKARKSLAKSPNSPEFKPLSPFAFKKIVDEKMKELHMDASFLSRNLNEGFSGGEKKKSEIVQMAILEPKYAILDETDSGLDVSALKVVGETAYRIAKEQEVGMLVITHYPRLLKYLKPDFVHVFMDGKIVKSGPADLAHQIEEKGYEAIK